MTSAEGAARNASAVVRVVRRLASLALAGLFLTYLFWLWPRSVRASNVERDWPVWDHALLDVSGVLAIATGLTVAVWCAITLVRAGRGTPVPTDPPELLVAEGPYARSRNPMYLAYLVILLGEALLLGEAALFLYVAIVAASTQLWLLAVEEPGLRRRFGDAFRDYARRVPRWV